jgi:hypothetical protein
LSDISISNFQVGLLENVILPLLKDNIKLQLNAGAEIVMIFDSAAHQLADEDFKIYLDKTFNELAKEFPNKVGYYAKDGINYDIIIDKKKPRRYCTSRHGFRFQYRSERLFQSNRQWLHSR